MIEEVLTKVVRHVVRVSVYRNDGTSSLRHHGSYVEHFPSEESARTYIRDIVTEQRRILGKIVPPRIQTP